MTTAAGEPCQSFILTQQNRPTLHLSTPLGPRRSIILQFSLNCLFRELESVAAAVSSSLFYLKQPEAIAADILY
jgi:hypothetical protein